MWIWVAVRSEFGVVFEIVERMRKLWEEEVDRQVALQCDAVAMGNILAGVGCSCREGFGKRAPLKSCFQGFDSWRGSESWLTEGPRDRLLRTFYYILKVRRGL